MAPTPDQIEKIKQWRVAMKADPSIVNDSIAKLSAAAQVPAKAIRDVTINEEDAAVMSTKIAAIRAPLSAAVKELEGHRNQVAEKYGLTKCE